jgi:hypothetical protein
MTQFSGSEKTSLFKPFAYQAHSFLVDAKMANYQADQLTI